MASADDPLIARLRMLAAVAVRHASEFHGVALGDDVAVLEPILAAEAGDPGQAGTIATCYGAWFGELLVRRLGGRWIALHEATAPRIALGRAVVSPIDAVRRRLRSPQAAALGDLFAQAQAWAEAAMPAATVLAENARAWDRLARDPRFTAGSVPVDRAAADDLLDPWLLAEGVAGRRVLCLAAGGGRHGPLLAQAGAEVTVLDLAPAQLAIDTALAAAHGLRLATVRASIEDLAAVLPAAAFDVVVQPVSATYVRDLAPVHAGLAHVLRPGGLLVAQHKQPAALQAQAGAAGSGWAVDTPHVEGLPLPELRGHSHREAGTQEFLHTLEALVGGLCRAGFVVEDLAEPASGDAWATPGSEEHRAAYLPPYLKLKARRR